MTHRAYYLTKRVLLVLLITIGAMSAPIQAADTAPYKETGVIGRISLSEQIIVIDDTKYKLPALTQGTSQTGLRKGMRVGYTYSQTGSRTITGIWVLSASK